MKEKEMIAPETADQEKIQGGLETIAHFVSIEEENRLRPQLPPLPDLSEESKPEKGEPEESQPQEAVNETEISHEEESEEESEIEKETEKETEKEKAAAPSSEAAKTSHASKLFRLLEPLMSHKEKEKEKEPERSEIEKQEEPTEAAAPSAENAEQPVLDSKEPFCQSEPCLQQSGEADANPPEAITSLEDSVPAETLPEGVPDLSEEENPYFEPVEGVDLDEEELAQAEAEKSKAYRRPNISLKDENGRLPESMVLVLGGGGSKGCYHVGVWQAFNECGIHFDGVAGTSIGALVGIFYPGNRIEKVTGFVRDMHPQNIASELPFMPATWKETVHSSRTILEFLWKYMDTKMDIEPLRQHFREMFNYEDFAASPIAYACMTYNDTKKEARAFFKEEITAENAEDIVMASSACYPAFPKVTMDGEEYMDGMYSENVPISLARQIVPQADRVVVVDIHDMSVPVPGNLEEDMFYIEPILPPGNPLDFSRKHADRLYCQGYLEARKYLGLNPGEVYTFCSGDEQLMQVMEDYLKRQFLQFHLEVPQNFSRKAVESFSGLHMPEFVNPLMPEYEMGRFVEALAFLAGIDPVGLYDYRTFLHQMTARLNASGPLPKDVSEDEFKIIEMFRKLKKEELPWFFHWMLVRNHGNYPSYVMRAAAKAPVSSVMAYVWYFLEELTAFLPEKPLA